MSCSGAFLRRIPSKAEAVHSLVKFTIPANKLELAVSDEELLRRRERWQPRQPKITTGYLARYAAMVTSGNRGAILEIK